MLFVNLASLVDGQLKNEPSIGSFTNIVFNSKRVKIGDLFIGLKKDIKEAVKNGAYGIVSNNIKIIDSEIAWIEVKNIEDAKLKLLRYLILKGVGKTILLDKSSRRPLPVSVFTIIFEPPFKNIFIKFF